MFKPVVACPSATLSATIREVKLDARARRRILKEANVADRDGVEVREFRYVGPSMQFLAGVEVSRGEKVEAKVDTGANLITKENMTSPRSQELLNPKIK